MGPWRRPLRREISVGSWFAFLTNQAIQGFGWGRQVPADFGVRESRGTHRPSSKYLTTHQNIFRWFLTFSHARKQFLLIIMYILYQLGEKKSKTNFLLSPLKEMKKNFSRDLIKLNESTEIKDRRETAPITCFFSSF